ncbi:GNAT family N-acetyltransferase [uncultured Maricaulis sp.]|uniref:GNAT family N-acetyltransferase n=1 Tax=uncultured Maricaulis sp. TaxID=174710 RepID=UPI0030D83530|tara:strand:+ start:87838 stop:88917 length:1080 start_codon:yes stop_codon:yes gene_type:complete
MDVASKRPSELTEAESQAWRAFVAADSALASPYFALEFAQCCEEARDDTRVLIVRRAGQIVGFLPLHTGKLGYARPLAGPMGDVQGVIAEPGIELDLHEVLRKAGLPLFAFHAGLSSQTSFLNNADEIVASWMLDLSEGYDAWEERRRQVDSKAIRTLRGRRRKLEELDRGHRYVMEETSPEAFDRMMEWKGQQYAATNVFNVFSVAWTRDLLKAVLRRKGEFFSGSCSSLYVGDQLVSVHIGMESDRLSHYWFPAYHADYGRLSAGVLLLTEAARAAAAKGHVALELGPGDFQFKRDLSSYQIGLARGCIANPSLLRATRDAGQALSRAAETAPIGPAKAWPGKLMRKIDRLSGFYAL